MSEIHAILQSIGLDYSDTELYLLIANASSIDATTLLKRSRYSRATVFSSLNTLEEHGLIEKRKTGRAVHYSIRDPQQLQTLYTQKKEDLEQLGTALEPHIDTLTQLYTIGSGKPSVERFVGIDQIRTLLFDTLNTKKPILSFVNSENVKETEEMQAINREYVHERKRKKIHKQIIWADTPAARKRYLFLKGPFTEGKFLNEKKYPFQTSLQIYENNIAYISRVEQEYIGFKIIHPGIASLHRSVFQALWDSLPTPL